MSALSLSLQARRGALTLDVALDLEEGPVAVLGPNGAGKTSLLRWLAGDDFDVEAASLRVRGDVWVDSKAGLWLPPEARRVGYVPQAATLLAPLTVRDNVAFGPRARGASEADARLEADAALARWGIAELAARRPATLSGGERQKVAFARAMVTEPRLILLDEPTSSLDPGARREMRARLTEACRGRPTLLVTHDVRDVQTVCTLVVVLEDGRVVQQGRAAELAAAPATPFVREFFEPFRSQHE